MANESKQGGTSVIETVKEAIKSVTPARLGDYSIAGYWLARRDDYLTFFHLERSGKGKEYLMMDDEVVTIGVEWEMKESSLVITSHADQDYVHTVAAAPFEQGGFHGQGDSGAFRLIPLR